MRLLVVEDDFKLVRALERGLQREGYTVDVARTGDEALAQATACDYDAIVLDLMLPGLDGLSVCQALRRNHRWMPILILTARSEVADRIRGLDAGADDYLVKPFEFGELLARLRALTRRPAKRPAPLAVGDLVLEPATRVVIRAGRRVELAPREFEVLEFLMRHAGQVVSRASLLEHVWGAGTDTSHNIVDVYIGYLRKKLERRSGRQLIRTVRGVGFMVESK